MRIVSNTGPLIGLAKIGKLSLLQSLAEEVLIPRRVYQELMGKVGSETEDIEHVLEKFLRVTDLKPLEPATEIAIAGLDEGEKQAIGLASNFAG